jgi:hypothetical protein
LFVSLASGKLTFILYPFHSQTSFSSSQVSALSGVSQAVLRRRALLQTVSIANVFFARCNVLTALEPSIFLTLLKGGFSRRALLQKLLFRDCRFVCGVCAGRGVV